MSDFHPEFLKMLASLGHEAYQRLPEVISEARPPVSIRLNASKPSELNFDNDGAVEWCAEGVYLKERPKFTHDPALHQGRYYVQDASSMAITAAIETALTLIEAEAPIKYLDACAAPGGKTTAALQALPEGSFVVANEADPRRCSILAENLAKWGKAAIITCQDASKISGLDGFYDIISADLPCSGEGMMRKDPKALEQWTPGLVNQCAELQKSILKTLWNALKPGGALILSTCTFNPRENEQNVNLLIQEYGARALEIPALNRPDILGASKPFDFPCYHFLPGTIRGEGLFMALLVKPTDEICHKAKKTKNKAQNIKPLPLLEGEWIYRKNAAGEIYALPKQWGSLLDSFPMEKIRSIGITVGEEIHGKLIPSQSLAMAWGLKKENFVNVDVDRKTALEYLHGNPVTLPASTEKGMVLLTYEGHALGFVKNIGNRVNNLYPRPWRVLT